MKEKQLRQLLSKDRAAATDSSETFSSLHEEVVAVLRKRIAGGEFSPGSRVPEQGLSEELGISRTPLREALKVLASEGLIELAPNRGARIRQLDAAGVRQLFEVMAGLEASVGRWACERMTDADLTSIEELHYKMYSCFIRQNLLDYFKYNQDIHEFMKERSGNPALISTYNMFAARLTTVRYAANLDRSRDRWGDGMREHEMIIDALRRRSGPDIAEILHQHLMNSCTAALEHIKALK